jgi:hypothetical protein
MAGVAPRSWLGLDTRRWPRDAREVGIHQQRDVNRSRRQAWICLRALDRDDIVGFELPFVLFNDGEHFGLDVHSVDGALRHHAADAHSEIAGACSYVSHNISRFELHMLNDLLWCFGLCTLRAFKPLGAGYAHHLSDFAAHIKLANAVGMVLGARFVDGRAAPGAAVCCACMLEA